MGFWHTGYMEFHEPVGLGDLEVAERLVVVYHCDQCDESFPSPEALRIHRFEAHPALRPVLIVRGFEVGNAPLRLTRPLTLRDVKLVNATEAAINGELVRLDAVAQMLAHRRCGTADVVLNNETVQAYFTLRFEIATPADIAGVEECFRHAAHRGRLDRRSIEDFIEQAKSYPTAIAYCDGICEYLYGVLAKERSPESSLPFDMYREKFNRAADSLRDMNRPLARLICGLVHFHFNHFAAAVRRAPSSRLDFAASRLLGWVRGNSRSGEAASRGNPKSADSILTDLDTERVLRWILADPKDAKSQLSEVEAALDEDIAELDRVKLRILLAETYRFLGDKDRATRHARELINSPTFGRWAARLTRHKEYESTQNA